MRGKCANDNLSNLQVVKKEAYVWCVFIFIYFLFYTDGGKITGNYLILHKFSLPFQGITHSFSLSFTLTQ